MKRFAGFGKTIHQHPLAWSLSIGGSFMAAWTLFRFFTDKSIFDLVDRQLFARSIVQGATPDAIFGPTSYLVKVFTVYIPFELLHLSPRLSLIIMTLLLNLAAYVLIVLAARSILRQLKVKIATPFYIAIIWLAATAGSIFWIEFANSRNIEVAAGLWVVALGLRYIKNFEPKIAWLLLGVSALTFYMDPLQVYMTAVPLVVFALLASRSVAPRRRRLMVYGSFGAILIAAYIMATLATGAVDAVLGISVVSAGSAVAGALTALSHFGDAVRSLVVANVRLLGGVVENGGRLHQVVVLAGVIIALGIWLWQAIAKRLNRELVTFVAVFGVVIEVVYLLSGQAGTSDTSRYLIMLAPVCVIAIASLSLTGLRKVALGAITLVIIVNALFLVGMAPSAWRDRFSQDNNLTTIAQYVEAHPGVNFYASMDTALPAIYFNPGLSLRPLACDSGNIEKVKRGPYNVQTTPTEQSAVILDTGQQISNIPQVCTDRDIERQLGGPIATQAIDQNHEVLVYPTGLLEALK